MICGVNPVYARSPSPSQRPAPTTIASRSSFLLDLCSCSTSLSKMAIKAAPKGRRALEEMGTYPRGTWYGVGGNRSKEQDRKSEFVLRSTYQIFEWDRDNSDRNFYNVVRYVHIPLEPWMQERSEATCHIAMPQCCYLAKGAKRPSHTTNTIKFDRIPFDPRNSIKMFDLCPFDQRNSTYLQPPLDMTL